MQSDLLLDRDELLKCFCILLYSFFNIWRYREKSFKFLTPPWLCFLLKLYIFLHDIIKEKLFIKGYFCGSQFFVFSHIKVTSLPRGTVFCLQWHPRGSIKMHLDSHCPQKCHIIKFNLLSNKFLTAFKSKRGSVGITLYITSLNKHFLHFLGDRKIIVK